MSWQSLLSRNELLLNSQVVTDDPEKRKMVKRQLSSPPPRPLLTAGPSSRQPPKFVPFGVGELAWENPKELESFLTEFEFECEEAGVFTTNWTPLECLASEEQISWHKRGSTHPTSGRKK